jgi:hypothetical protein
MDAKEQVYREVDVYAVADAAGVRVSLVIEAKSGRPGAKPWVILLSGSNVGRSPLHPIANVSQRYTASRDADWWHQYGAGCPAIQGLEVLRLDDAVGYALTRASLDRRDSRDEAYAALMQSVQGAYGICQEARDYFSVARSQDADDLSFELALPVIVVDSPLFQCRLDEHGEIQVSEIDVGTVVWRNRAYGQDAPHSIVKIMREAHLPSYAQAVVTAARIISERRNS